MKYKIPEIVDTEDQIIICPGCEKPQEAEAVLYDGYPFWSYVHTCGNCGYIIMESEWQTVDEADIE